MLLYRNRQMRVHSVASRDWLIVRHLSVLTPLLDTLHHSRNLQLTYFRLGSDRAWVLWKWLKSTLIIDTKALYPIEQLRDSV